MTGRPVLALAAGDVIRLRRPHACGGDTWVVDRIGADIGARCTTCGRRILLDRPVLERRILGRPTGIDADGRPEADRRPEADEGHRAP